MQGGINAAQDASNEEVNARFTEDAKTKIENLRTTTGVNADTTAEITGGAERNATIWKNLTKLPKVERKSEGIEGGTEGKTGFFSKLTSFFSADSPWMTKLGDFFGGDSELSFRIKRLYLVVWAIYLVKFSERAWRWWRRLDEPS